MIKKSILIFVPMIGGGGVEKNLFIIANYLSNHFETISIISTSKGVITDKEARRENVGGEVLCYVS